LGQNGFVPNYICRTCGVQYADSHRPPVVCRICDDERQYIGHRGQQWTTLEELRASGYTNHVEEADSGVVSIFTSPAVAIGQRAILVRTGGGNFLWDSITYIDEATVEKVRAMGGIQGISVSHPHFYSSVVEWSSAFDNAPIYIPEADREYFVRPDRAVQYYSGKVDLWPGLTLIQCGGHFEGSAVLHWAEGADGKGVLFTGDSISVAADRRWVTFMRSYPNYIPLPPGEIRGILAAIEPYEFDRIHGGWFGNDVREDAKAAVWRSAERYIKWTGGTIAPDPEQGAAARF
jgi:glyoxylase-like metal-dependent hydrolase (beta-lactamase superfamily II)